MRKKVIVTVDEQGAVHTDYQHFEGTSCLATGQQLHALLMQFGVQVEQTSLTPKPELLAALGQPHEQVSAREALQLTEGEG